MEPELSEGNRRLAAIMFTDMVGYTALGQRNESLSLALVEEQRKLIRPILGRHKGREVKTIGDAFLVEFPNAVDALRCAYDIQRTIREFNLSLAPGARIHLRVGVHVGEVTESQGDISGDAVNIASRIEPLAQDGGVCVTRQVYDLTYNKLDIPLSSLGPRSLKNVANPMEVYRMVMPWEEDEDSAMPKLDRLRVAILPFSNISPDSNDVYIADGMTEELISTMSKIGGLNVLARTSVMRYKGGERNIEEIAKELKSGTVVEGSVRKAGDKVRITVQVIDADSSVHLWSESYDRDMKDVFAVQADISQAVASSLKVRLLEEEKTRIRREPTKNSQAHALYLKGVYLNMNEYDNESATLSSIACLKRAIELDPGYASAYAFLADSYIALYAWGHSSPDKAFPPAEEAVTKALDLDPNLAEAHRSMGLVRYFKHDWRGAAEECKKAVDLNPNDAWNHAYYAQCLAILRRLEEAEAEAHCALDLAPIDRPTNQVLASVLYRQRKYGEVLAHLEKLVQLDPDFALFHDFLGLSYYGLAQYDKAAQEFQKAIDSERSSVHLSNWGVACAKLGRINQAREVLSELNDISTKKHVSPGALAQIHVALGENNEALTLLEKAVKDQDSGTMYDMQFDSMYDGLRSDPRFIALLGKIPPV